jgi:hypothetical protein
MANLFRSGSIRSLLPTRNSSLIPRDITEIHSRYYVLFSADTASAGLWMRQKYGTKNVIFKLPSQGSDALAFKVAAEARNFSMIVMANRRQTLAH